MATKVDVKFDGMLALARLGVTDGRMQRLLATQIMQVSDPYTPFRDGYLKNSAEMELDGRRITYGSRGQSSKYARRLWYGDGFNFKGAPIRGSRWVERAWAVNGDQVVRNIQNQINRGGIK